MTTPPPDRREGRPLAALALLLPGSLLLGVLLGPPCFHVWMAMAPHLGLKPVDFPEVVSRLTMIATLALLVPCYRLSGMGSDLRASLRLTPERRRALALAFVLGTVSMSALYILGLAVGAYTMDHPGDGPAAWMLRLLACLPASALVGVFEEVFFRGFIFGSLRRRLSFWPAALAAAAFFSALHFARPSASAVGSDPAWWSGFALLPHAFADFTWRRQWSFVVTLVLMALLLSVLFERRRHLDVCIGLHAGWVMALMFGSDAVTRDRAVLYTWFGNHDLVARGAIAIPVVAAFLAAALLIRRRPSPPA